jgi:hypothetical protein
MGRTARAAAIVATSLVLASALAGSTAAQVDPGAGGGEQIQREARLRQLRQLELDTRYRANQAIPPGQRLRFDYGGYFTFNYLDLDDPEKDNHILREYDGLAYARLNFDGAHELFLRGRIGWQDFHRGDSFSGRGDEPIDGDLDRGYYRFDLRRYNAAYGRPGDGDFNLIAQGGRDLVYWANGLVMAQVIDGGIFNLSSGPLSLEFIAGITPVRTIDIDSSRPGFDYNTRRAFYGAMVAADAGEHRPFAYFLAQQDHNTKDERRIGSILTRYHYDSYYVGAGSTGEITDRLRYGVEVAYEFGDTLSNSFELIGFGIVPVEQTRDNIDAAAGDVRLDYLLADPADTRLSAEFIAATGDSDRGHTSNTFNGNRPRTDDHAFNSFGLLNTGLAFAPDVSNLFVARVGASTFPFHHVRPLRRLQVGGDFFVFNKFRETAPIDETTQDERFLGVEPDVYLNWQVTSDVTLALRYGVFFPSDDAFPIDEARHFFFAGVTFAF